jgi:pimeloyl-ACP methyl ester carboxylesterase/Mg-chelatase subunit ChlD
MMTKSSPFKLILSLLLACLQPACTPTTTPQPAPTAPKPANLIGAEGGTITVAWPHPGSAITQVTLRIPTGAVTRPIAWTVQPAAPTAESPPTWQGLAPVVAVKVGPADAALTQPLELEFQLNPAKLAAAGIVDAGALVGQLATDSGLALPVDVSSSTDLLSIPGAQNLWSPPSPATIAVTLLAVGNMKIFGPHVVPNPATWQPPYASKHPPVLLVHGWQAAEDVQDLLQVFNSKPDATSWGALSPDHGNLLAKQETDPAEVFELRYYTGFTIPKSAMTLAKTLAAIRAATGQKTVTIVAHSMGGLVSRTYTLSSAYANDVERLITLGTPHAGTTDLLQNAIDNALGSYKGPGKLALELFTSSAEMLSGSTFLKLLNAKPPADLAGPAPDYHMIRGTKDLLVPVKYASMTASLGLEGKEHPNIVDYCEVDKYHTSVGFGSGVADITGKGHPAYPLVCRAVGLTSDCGGFAAWETGVCSCRAACAKVELPYTCSPGKGQVTGTETCDLVDNDCNGQTDEVPADQLASDINNCGQCGKSCLAGQTCTKGKCGAAAFSDPTDKQTTAVNVTVTQVEQTQGGKVKVFASVQTQSGDPIEQLTTGNFGIEETVNGVSVSVPVNSLEIAEESSNGLRAALVIDSSGSMYTSPEPSALELAKAAAKEFVSYLKPGDEVAVVDFSSQVIVQQGLTNNKQALFTAIDACDQGGGTAMFDGAEKGLDLLATQTGQRAVLLLTDGEDTASTCGDSSQCIAGVVNAAKQQGTPVYAIGLGLTAGSPGESDLLALAQGSNAGGKGIGYYYAPGGNQLKALYEKLATILKKTYVVGWYTTAKPGQKVSAKVKVTYSSAMGQLTDTFDISFVGQ